MAEFKYFRHTLTGKVGQYPADFDDLFPDVFIEVDSNAADCVDCWLKDEDAYSDEFIQDVDDADFLATPLDLIDDDDDFPDTVVVDSYDETKDK